MTQFRLVTEQERTEFAPELVGTGHKLVSDGEKLWVVKHKPSGINEEKRDRLAYLLGKDFANIAEVRLLNDEELQNIKTLTDKRSNVTINNTFLIRLSGSYSLDELPCKTLEEAVAMELVYSLFIRRRDTHSRNRGYVHGLPVFFDHQVAFLGDYGLENIDSFFSKQGEGHAGSWRVRQWKKPITTSQSREKEVDTHWVNNLDEFNNQIDLSILKVISLVTEDSIRIALEQVAFSPEESIRISQFLVANKNTLNQDVEKMRRVIFLG